MSDNTNELESTLAPGDRVSYAQGTVVSVLNNNVEVEWDISTLRKVRHLAPDALTKLIEPERITELERENADLRRKLESDDKEDPGHDGVGAFMDYDQQGVALFLGGGNVLIIHDDGTTRGNAIELTDIQRAVLGARLRKISNLIVTRQLS